MQFTLDQRRYRLNLSRKQLWEECSRRGRKIGYSSVCKAIDTPVEVGYKTEKKVSDTITELENEHGITGIDFD